MICEYFSVFSLQTVNPQEAEVEEAKPDPGSDTVPAEPDPQSDLDLKTDAHDQETSLSSTPEPVPAQGQVSTDIPAQAEVHSGTPAAHPSLDSNPVTPPDEAENTPTSESASPAHTG